MSGGLGAAVGQIIGWESFDRLLSDYDLLNVTVEEDAVPADVVDFRLETAPHITWWKAIRVPDGRGSSWEIWTQDDRHSDSVALWAWQVANGQRLEFKKAKLFGVHTGMYELGGLERLMGGSRVTFRWVQDEEVDLEAAATGLTIGLPKGSDGRYRAAPGQVFTARLGWRSWTEYFPWSRDTRIRLASTHPADNTAWGLNRVDLSGQVVFWQTATFEFTATAPAAEGDYPFHWTLIQEGVRTFGPRAIPDVTVRQPAPSSGEMPLRLDQNAQSWITYDGAAGDPSVSPGYPEPRHATIAWVRNDTTARFYLFHADRRDAQSPPVLVPANATVTGALAGMEVEGLWQAQYRGAEATAPAQLGLTVGWQA